MGIKVNCIAGKSLSTRPEVVASIIAGLKLAGIAEENIIVWDRTNRELVEAGYRLNRKSHSVRCCGTEHDYDAEPTRLGSFNGRLSRILSDRITALINVPVLKDHGGAGITAAMKNHYGSIHNPGAHHRDFCSSVADLNAVPAIKNKTRLVVCDALRAVAEGGPKFAPGFVWEPHLLLISAAPAVPDLIECGLDGLESLQPEAMDVYRLKREYGNDLRLWGGLGAQSTLPFGTPDEVRNEVRRLKRELGHGGGYVLAGAKGIGTEVPIPNVIAYLEEASRETGHEC